MSRSPGAPNPVVVERRGDDARLVAWNPGEPLRVVRTFTKAFTGDAQTAVVSPDATALVVATVHPDSEDAQDTARLVTNDGLVAWEGAGDHDQSRHHLVERLEEGRAGGRPWGLVGDHSRSGRDSGIAARRHRRPVRRDLDAESAGGAVRATLGQPGRSRASRFLGRRRVAVCVRDPARRRSRRPDGGFRSPAGSSTRSPGYATSGPARLAAGDGLRGIDPTTGRAIRWGANAAIPGGPPTVEVDDADGTLAYRVETGVVLGAAWETSGDLLILEADGYPFPTRLRLLPIGKDGTVGSPILTTGPVAFGGLLGARNGFAVLAFGTRQPTDGIQFVVVNLADGTASGLTLPAVETGILGASLLP